MYTSIKTIAKIQRLPLAAIFESFIPLLRNPSESTLRRLLASDTLTRTAYAELSYLQGALEPASCKVNEKVIRMMVNVLFSLTQRGGGSTLAGFAPVDLDDNNCRGFSARFRADKECLVFGRQGNVESFISSSGHCLSIGFPYNRAMLKSLKFIAQGIDCATAALSLEVRSRREQQGDLSVEDLTAWCVANPQIQFRRGSQGGRFLCKADYFLYPPPSLRQKVLENQGVSETLARELRTALEEGEYRVAVMDISGGAGGVGIADAMHLHWELEPPDCVAAYVDHLLHHFRNARGCDPEQALVVCTRREYASLGSLEFEPARQELSDRGFPCHLVFIDDYEKWLQGSGLMRSDGKLLSISRTEPVLVARRYAYLFEHEGCERGRIADHPQGVLELPSDESRINASDCRVNLPLLEWVTRPMRGRGNVSPDSPFELIPHVVLDLNDAHAPYAAMGFLDSCQEAFPEVLFLGGVAKPADKVPRNLGSLVKTAYPLPPGPCSGQAMDVLVRPLFRKLLSRGIGQVVVMPNVLPVLVDQNGKVLPKCEIRLIKMLGALP